MRADRVLMSVAGVAAVASCWLLFGVGKDQAIPPRAAAVVEQSHSSSPTAEAPRGENSRITFLSNRNGRNVLYQMNPDGGEIRPIFGGVVDGAPGLAEGTVWYREPHWSRVSPDGRYFLSWAVDHLLPAGRDRMPPRFLLHLGRVDGGPTRVLTPDAEEIFAWSPDSRRFAFARTLWHNPANLRHPIEPRSQVIVAAIDGSGETILLDRPGVWIPLDWSPDGKHLLVSYQSSPIYQQASSALFELEIAQAEATNMADAVPGVSPSQNQSETTPEGGGLRSIVPLKPGLGVSMGRYAPDGKTIALIRSGLKAEGEGLIDPLQFASSFEMGLFSLDDATYRTLDRPTEPVLFSGPITWSPDGRQILFARFDRPEQAIAPPSTPKGDTLAIWSIDRDGGRPRRITGGWAPDWRGEPGSTPTPVRAAENNASTERKTIALPDAETPSSVTDEDAATTMLKLIGLGLKNFQQAQSTQPEPKRSRLPIDQQASWIVAALPYLARGDLHDRIHSAITDGDDRPWNDPANREAIGEVLTPFLTPGMTESGMLHDDSGAGLTGFVGVSGTGPNSPALPQGSDDPRRGYFGHYRMARPDEVTDGQSTTAMLMEVQRDRGPWARNGPATVRPIESFEGGLMLMGDGSVRTLTRSVDPKLLRSMSTIAAKD